MSNHVCVDSEVETYVDEVIPQRRWGDTRRYHRETVRLERALKIGDYETASNISDEWAF